MIDCGRSAVTQYQRAGLDYKSLRAIFLTHLHADHIADYYNFLLLSGITALPNGDVVRAGLPVYGPGSAGGLAPAFGGKTVPTISENNPTPGTAALTQGLHEAFAYSSNVFMRDTGMRDIRKRPVLPLGHVLEHRAGSLDELLSQLLLIDPVWHGPDRVVHDRSFPRAELGVSDRLHRRSDSPS